MSHAKPKRRRRRSRGGKAEPGRALVVPGMSPEKAAAYAEWRYQQHQMEISLMRRLANHRGWARLCPRKGCRRAGICTGAQAECLAHVGLPAGEPAPDDMGALRALRDRMKASLAEAEE